MTITLTWETRREWEIYEQDLKREGELKAMCKLEALRNVLYTLGDAGTAIMQQANDLENKKHDRHIPR